MLAKEIAKRVRRRGKVQTLPVYQARERQPGTADDSDTGDCNKISSPLKASLSVFPWNRGQMSLVVCDTRYITRAFPNFRGWRERKLELSAWPVTHRISVWAMVSLGSSRLIHGEAWLSQIDGLGHQSSQQKQVGVAMRAPQSSRTLLFFLQL